MLSDAASAGPRASVIGCRFGGGARRVNSLFEECEARGADCAKNKRRAPVRSTDPGHFTILNIFFTARLRLQSQKKTRDLHLRDCYFFQFSAGCDAAPVGLLGGRVFGCRGVRFFGKSGRKTGKRLKASQTSQNVSNVSNLATF